MEPLLTVVDLSVRVRTHRGSFTIVNNASFQLERQKVLALVGESGSGKTSTALALLQLVSKKRGYETSGAVWFENENLLTCSQKRWCAIRGRKISMIFQDPSTALHPLFSVGSQLEEAYTAHGKETSREKIRTLFAKVGLPIDKDYFEIYPHQLSGGIKQRVVIAIALCLGPQIVIADEPTTALDMTVQKEILSLLNSMKQEQRIALLIITHDLDVVAEIADSVAIMRASEIIELGSCREIFFHPAHPYTQALIQARPTEAHRKQPLPTVPNVLPARPDAHKVILSPTHWVRL